MKLDPNDEGDLCTIGSFLAGHLLDELSVGEKTTGVNACICLVPNVVEVISIKDGKIRIHLDSNEPSVRFNVKESAEKFFDNYPDAKWEIK